MGTALRADDDADDDVVAGVHPLARRASGEGAGVGRASRAAPRDDADARGEEEDAGE